MLGRHEHRPPASPSEVGQGTGTPKQVQQRNRGGWRVCSAPVPSFLAPGVRSALHSAPLRAMRFALCSGEPLRFHLSPPPRQGYERAEGELGCVPFQPNSPPLARNYTSRVPLTPEMPTELARPHVNRTRLRLVRKYAHHDHRSDICASRSSFHISTELASGSLGVTPPTFHALLRCQPSSPFHISTELASGSLGNIRITFPRVNRTRLRLARK